MNKDACDQVTYNYEDIFMPMSGPACFKIIRKWTVIDWCQFDSKAKSNEKGKVRGKWTHTQTIKVIDFSPPVFEKTSNIIKFENFESDFGQTYVELIAQAKDCSPNLKYTYKICLLYTSPSPRDQRGSRMPSSA